MTWVHSRFQQEIIATHINTHIQADESGFVYICLYLYGKSSINSSLALSLSVFQSTEMYKLRLFKQLPLSLLTTLGLQFSVCPPKHPLTPPIVQQARLLADKKRLLEYFDSTMEDYCRSDMVYLFRLPLTAHSVCRKSLKEFGSQYKVDGTGILVLDDDVWNGGESIVWQWVAGLSQLRLFSYSDRCLCEFRKCWQS